MSIRTIYELTTEIHTVRNDVLFAMISDATLILNPTVKIITVPSTIGLDPEIKSDDYLRALRILEQVILKWEGSVNQIRFYRGEVGCGRLKAITEELYVLYDKIKGDVKCRHMKKPN